MSTQLPRYTDRDGRTYEYEPPALLGSLRRYNIAQCARERMSDAHTNGYYDPNDSAYSIELWKRERVAFWTTLQHSIPYNFRANR